MGRNSVFPGDRVPNHDELVELGTERLNELLVEAFRRLVNLQKIYGPYRRSGREQYLQWSLEYDYKIISRALETLKSTGNKIASFDLDRKLAGISIIQIGSEINKEMIKYFQEHPSELKTMNRRLFEELIAELFYRYGFRVELTKQTRDGGRDIIAVHNKPVAIRLLIEAKRPNPDNPVGIETVRELYGVLKDERATKAILAITTHFTKDALNFFNRHYWELEGKDFDDIIKWIMKYASNSGGNISY